MILRSLLLGIVFCGLAVAESVTTVTGLVVDGRTGLPLGEVNVVAVDAGTATVTHRDGMFTLPLPVGTTLTRLSLVGYQSRVLRLEVVDDAAPEIDTVQVQLHRNVIRIADEIVIEAASSDPAQTRTARGADRRVLTTTALIDRAEGVSLVRRANFGQDPAIRGTQPAQVGVVIEGMKIFHACVDRMDPVTSYVETENLQRLEISRGGFDLTQASAVGGVINLVTQKPRFDAALAGHSQFGIESASRHRFSRNVLHLSKGDFAARGSFSYRRSSDMAAGGRGPIDNTQFAKYNYKLDVVRRSDQHRFEAGVLADEAWDIGYPALLMDARRASSLLLNAVHEWTPEHPRVHSLQTKLYVSDVDHWMDDEHRDVTQRQVMRDMNMPMQGQTRTWGLLQTLSLSAHRQTLRVILDAYQLQAFADMEMISVLPDVSPMYLLNLADVNRRHAALTADYQRTLTQRLEARVNIRVDRIAQNLQDPVGRQQLSATWGSEDLDKRLGARSMSMMLSYAQNTVSSWTFAWSNNARLPTPLESYGFFLFNPADGYFYTGKPSLRPEQSQQMEIGWQYEREGRRVSLRLYDNRMSDYIVGVVQESIFKTYQNIDRARLQGVELGFGSPLGHSLTLHGDASYTYGRNETFEEPLPFVAPLEARLGLTREGRRTLFEINSRLVARQARIAHRTTLEDETPAFAVIDLRAVLDVGDNYRLDVGIDNLFDHYYYEHLSVGNFPNPGRNLRLALDVGF